MQENTGQSFNPYLPSWEYIPDGEPYVFQDRVYVFGSHDRFNGTQFCMNDYVCWSASVYDLSSWHFEGVIYKKSQDPDALPDSIMQAPDIERGPDGRYYLYYTLGLKPFISVAVSNSPIGPYSYYGTVKCMDGAVAGMREHDVFHFDPGVFRDEDGRIYLYSGFGPDGQGIFRNACEKYQMRGAYVAELEEDMLTMKTEPKLLIPKEEDATGTEYEGHGFFEASSMRKINGRYYFIYSSVLSHELCYAVSDYPDKDFTYGGTLVSIGDIGYHGRKEPDNYLGNTHGSLVKIRKDWFVFYHRQTNRNNYSRQACAEKIVIAEDGSIGQAEITSCGLNQAPLSGKGTYPAYIACNLRAQDGALTYGTAETPEAEKHPYFTQTGEDREENGDQYIANMQNGASAGYKYFNISAPSGFEVLVSGEGEGAVSVSLADGGKVICTIPIRQTREKVVYQSPCKSCVEDITGIYPLYFTYEGSGYMNFHEFTIK